MRFGGEMAKASETGIRDKFTLWSKSDRPTREGTVLDIDTGVLRRDHVLVLRSPQAEITLGLGGTAAALMNFAHKGETYDEPLFKACDEADQALARGDFKTTRDLGVPDVIATIENAALRRLALVECFLEKASPDDPKKPGWPAGTPGGLGGKFMPKDKSPAALAEATQKLKRLEALREFRAALEVALVVVTAAPLEVVPGVDVAVSIEAAATLATIAVSLGNDEIEINRAIDFVEKGPYTLDQLQVQGNGDSFSSFDDFKKTSIIEAMRKAYGSAGPGEEWHHIVEQGGGDSTNFSPEQLHSTDNIMPLPGPVHDLVTAEYASEYDDSGKSVREWLSGQSFEAQRDEGIKILRRLGIVK
jgi:hypothetical protein